MSTVKLLRHVVLFKFKETTTETKINEVTDFFSALPSKIDLIKDFEWGTDVSIENKHQGFTHCFVVSFSSSEDRDTYISHPAHKALGGVAGGFVEKVLVIDYWAN